jgi:mannose-1-phosphate guanylyltransferase/mannose-6-phosphate isomerase
MAPSSSPLVAVILAGGSGTRLWPMSRQMFPKQLMSLHGGESMLAATINRLHSVIAKNDIWAITNPELARGAGYQELRNLQHILEPVARNTAPAIGVMAAYLADFAHDPVMLILPADHVIGKVEAFHQAIQVAAKAAEEGKIVTFGIQPTHAETGYGYIQARMNNNHGVYPVEKFVEKPNLATAERYVASRHYYWNSGMFVAKASVILAELERYAEGLSRCLGDIRTAWRGGTPWQEAIDAHFTDMPSISIDYAVMEKSDNVAVVPCDIGWSDVGSWDAVYELADKDSFGNALKGPSVVLESRNNLIIGRERVIATLGVENLCIIDTPDALLVALRSRVQEVKSVVQAIQARGGVEHITHRSVERPWGRYTILQDDVPGYKIKRIDVNPNGRLSFQSHSHRSEHWVVVAGRATVTCDDKTFTLDVGESTFIPLGARHRLENMENNPLQIVETQVGDYLGEDDIVRYDDVYGR